jgi:hypothetical protein
MYSAHIQMVRLKFFAATGTTGTGHCRAWGGTAQTSDTIQSEKSKSKGEPQWRKKLLT